MPASRSKRRSSFSKKDNNKLTKALTTVADILRKIKENAQNVHITKAEYDLFLETYNVIGSKILNVGEIEVDDPDNTLGNTDQGNMEDPINQGTDEEEANNSEMDVDKQKDDDDFAEYNPDDDEEEEDEELDELEDDEVDDGASVVEFEFEDLYRSVRPFIEHLKKAKSKLTITPEMTLTIKTICVGKRTPKSFRVNSSLGSKFELHAQFYKLINILVCSRRPEYFRLKPAEKKWIELFKINKALPLALYDKPTLVNHLSRSGLDLIKQWLTTKEAQDLPILKLVTPFCDFLDAMRAKKWDQAKGFLNVLGGKPNSYLEAMKVEVVPGGVVAMGGEVATGGVSSLGGDAEQ